jgi:hypothetical protein
MGQATAINGVDPQNVLNQHFIDFVWTPEAIGKADNPFGG